MTSNQKRQTAVAVAAPFFAGLPERPAAGNDTAVSTSRPGSAGVIRPSAPHFPTGKQKRPHERKLNAIKEKDTDEHGFSRILIRVHPRQSVSYFQKRPHENAMNENLPHSLRLCASALNNFQRRRGGTGKHDC